MGKIYIAPLEGITGHVFRQAYHTCINPHIQKYFTPFISPNQNRCMSGREKRDILPENNKGITLIPQILTKDPKRFLDTARELKEYGYTEVNLNLGCPSPTVTTKKKGAGMLADLSELERFLDAIFTNPPVEISIKTRLGIEKEEEWEPLLELYNRYPVKELIVHARLLKDFYKGTPRYGAFQLAMEKSVHPLCYNGDIFTLEEYQRRQTGNLTVMLGRGILFHPSLSVEIMEQPAYCEPDFRAFHDMLVEGYERELSGDSQVIQKMKELWGYMIADFPNSEKTAKRIKKARNLQEYKAAVAKLL
ncbi:MAG: tRNA dihydrouridine synthase [Lachnospiraceae bacterium]